jgi:hypothetical protein
LFNPRRSSPITPVESLIVKKVSREQGVFSISVHCIDSKPKQRVYVVKEVVNPCNILSTARLHVKDICQMVEAPVVENVA